MAALSNPDAVIPSTVPNRIGNNASYARRDLSDVVRNIHVGGEIGNTESRITHEGRVRDLDLLASSMCALCRNGLMTPY